MIVTLNGRPFDLTLERERTVGELLEGMARWLEKSHFRVSGFKLNGRKIPVEKVDEACSTDLDEIESIEVTASSWGDLFDQALLECAENIDKAVIERRTAQAMGRKADTIRIAEAFENGAAAAYLSINANDVYISAIKALRGISIDPDIALTAVRADVAERITELETPFQELAKACTMMPGIAERLEALPLELQTGKDAIAAITLQTLASLIGKLLRLLPILTEAGVDLDSYKIAEYDFRDFFEELKTALKELTAGYENSDAILVGDLAEYELAPRLRTLAAALAEITDK